MSEYNPDIHHRRSIRLKEYDYSLDGLYFVTLCCQGKLCRFGKIRNGEMTLNAVGELARDEWTRTSEIRPNVQMNVFVIMPNHLHGIISITDNDGGGGDKQCFLNIEKGVCHTPLQPPPSPSKTVGAIIRRFKSAVTKQMKSWGVTDSLWQHNYYEHVIRTPESHQRITDYIANNPANWTIDKFYC